MSQPTRAKRVRFDHWGFIFIAPFFLVFLAFQVYPIFNTFNLAFTDLSGPRTDFKYVGFSNFIKTTNDVEIKGKTADEANNLVKALSDAGIDGATTDAPEANTAGAADPFSLDLTAPSPEPAASASASPEASPSPAAEADPYSLGGASSDTASTDGYTVSLTRLSSADLDKVKPVLIANGLDADAIAKATTLKYSGVVADSFFYNSLGNTVILWFFNFIPQIGFALLFAVWFTDVQLKLRLTGLFKTVYYMPNLIMPASIALLFANIFGYPNGPLNLFLVQQLGFNESVNFFRSEIWTRGIVSFIQFWMWYGNTLIVLIAGIVGIPESLYESAVVDGANSRQMFTKITLPLLRPVMSYTLVTSMIGGMNMYDIPYLLTNRRGSPNDSINTTFMYIFNTAFGSNNNYSYSAAISIGLFIIVLALSMFVFYMMRDKDEIEAKKLRRLAK